MADILQINKKKILIIGYGSMGKKYEKVLQKNYLIYFYDKKKIKKKKFIKKLNVFVIKKFYFIIIATPPRYHKKYCDMCVEASKDFIVEKPLFIKKKGWKKTIINIKKKKLVCSVAYPRRESEAHNYIKNIIKKGKIGKLIIIKSNFSQDFRKLRKDYKKIYYSKMSDSGGIIFDALSHHLNLLTYYAGKIRKINKSEMKLVYSDINVNDTALISIHFKNNVFGIIFGNQFQKPNIDEIEFIGTKSNIIFDRINNKLYLVNKNKRLIKSFNETYEDLFLSQIKNFLGCIKKRVKPKTTLSEEFENLSKL